jgi:hypothetical protein
VVEENGDVGAIQGLQRWNKKRGLSVPRKKKQNREAKKGSERGRLKGGDIPTSFLRINIE